MEIQKLTQMLTNHAASNRKAHKVAKYIIDVVNYYCKEAPQEIATQNNDAIALMAMLKQPTLTPKKIIIETTSRTINGTNKPFTISLYSQTINTSILNQLYNYCYTYDLKPNPTHKNNKPFNKWLNLFIADVWQYVGFIEPAEPIQLMCEIFVAIAAYYPKYFKDYSDKALKQTIRRYLANYHK